MDSISCYFIICVVCFPSLVVGTVTISFDPVKSPLTNSVDITCTLTGSSTNAVTWSFGSTTTTCGSGSCLPDPSPYTFSMSGNVYTLTLPSAAIGNCISYSCADAVISTDTKSEDLFVSYFDKADIVPTEPGANTHGTISVTTGCVLSPSDLTITWSKIQGGVEVTFTPDHPINTSDRSTCARTCHSEEDEKVTNGFNHTEYTGDNFVVVQYQVNVSHKSYPDASDLYTWTSASYKIEAECTCDDCKCKKKCHWIVILSIVMGVLGILLLPGTRPIKGYFGRKPALVDDSIGILCGVTSFVLGIVVQAIDCCEYTADCCKDLDCCKDECKRNWIENTGVAFIVIGVLVGIAGGVIFYLLWTNRMGPGNNAYKAKEAKDPGENHGMTGTSM